MFRALYYGNDIDDTQIAMALTIDNMVERGYTLQDCEKMGFRLPNTPLLPAIMAGVAKGKERYHKRLQSDAEMKARMSRV